MTYKQKDLGPEIMSPYLEAVSKSPLGGRPSPLALFVGVGRANPELVLRVAPPEGKLSN